MLTKLFGICATTTPAGTASCADFFSNGSWIYLVAIVLLGAFFFFSTRSQKKQDKQVNDMRNNLEVGDEITTIGGIIGRVVSIKEETVLLETSRDGTKIRILRSAVRCVDVKASDNGK